MTPEGLGKRHQSLSQMLDEIAADPSRDRISLRDVMDRAGDRAFGALLFTLALPNVVPAPPGTSAILALPMLLLAGQLAFGRSTPWLPRFIVQRSIERAVFARVMERVSRVLGGVEKVLRPRAAWLLYAWCEQLLGVLLFCLALVVFLPIPFGNIVPAIVICIIALGLLEHDGLVALLGAALAAATLYLLWSAITLVVRASIVLLERYIAP
jgi:hypothetical protein